MINYLDNSQIKENKKLFSLITNKFKISIK